MNIRAYCRIPQNTNRSIKAKEGSCPELMYDLFSELEGAKEIHIAAYLFNNPSYYDFLSGLARKGCKIRVTSLPIRGYSDKPTWVEGYTDKVSARHVAKQIYKKVNNTPNFELEIFPHLYVWYGALYAGGGASYSFHVKAIFAKFRNSINKSILSSGNFMLSDAFHSDNILVLEGISEYENTFKAFFNDLGKYSIPYDDFRSRLHTYRNEFMYTLAGREINLHKRDFRNCFFTAPFYLYDGEGSNHYAGNRIIELISKSSKRIWVCAQHFHDIASYDRERETIIKALYDKHISNPRVSLRFLKQVPHSSLADKRRAGIAETLFQFVMQAEQRYNRLAHDKFMIIDDILLVSTANYTPTQFAFGLRKMEFKDGDGNRKFSKEDNFSEVNGFVIIPSCPKPILEEYESHFNSLWDTGQDITINL